MVPRRPAWNAEVHVAALLEFTSGFLFRMALVVAILGTLFQFAQNALVVGRTSDTWQEGVTSALKTILAWMNPVSRVRSAGVVREILGGVVLAGVIVVPLFYLGHARLWGRTLGLDWPVVAAHVSDVLTKGTVVALLALLVLRLADAKYRAIVRPIDWIPISGALVAFVSGYLVAHPGYSPVSPDVTQLTHYVAADGLLLAVPFTRLVRCVLLPSAYEGAVRHRQEVKA